ncbi:MAG: ABC transporter permease [Gemmatimonadetes bacterium]|nr:ABC transporter permease [Gemmatimonadota bacterium]NNK62605.1 ABC transporter permease [Gemmatimonadota bacterium]
MSGVVWAVIRREYLQRVRTRWFVASTVAAPLFLALLIAIPAWMASREGDSRSSLVVIDRTGVLYDDVAADLENLGYEVQRAPDAPDAEEALSRRVEQGDLGGVLVLSPDALDRGSVRLVTGGRPALVRQMAIRQIVVQSALAQRLGADEAAARTLLGGGELELVVLSDGGTRADEPAFVAAYGGAFILYMTILFYAIAVMRSVLEEKTNRIVEVVISSMRPHQLMLGKILGVGAVGLTQLGIWAAAAAAMFVAGIPALLAANPSMSQLAELAPFLPGLGYLGLFLVFFLGGYFMYAGLYAAVGAMCNTDEEAQSAQFPVIMLLVVPIIFVTQVIAEPNAPLSVGLSLFPPFSPILMFARAATGAAPMWQIGVSVVGMVAAVLVIAWVAGRIYKVGILMAGKRPTLPELWRWVREA